MCFSDQHMFPVSLGQIDPLGCSARPDSREIDSLQKWENSATVVVRSYRHSPPLWGVCTKNLLFFRGPSFSVPTLAAKKKQTKTSTSMCFRMISIHIIIFGVSGFAGPQPMHDLFVMTRDYSSMRASSFLQATAAVVQPLLVHSFAVPGNETMMETDGVEN